MAVGERPKRGRCVAPMCRHNCIIILLAVLLFSSANDCTRVAASDPRAGEEGLAWVFPSDQHVFHLHRAQRLQLTLTATAVRHNTAAKDSCAFAHEAHFVVNGAVDNAMAVPLPPVASSVDEASDDTRFTVSVSLNLSALGSHSVSFHIPVLPLSTCAQFPPALVAFDVVPGSAWLQSDVASAIHTDTTTTTTEHTTDSMAANTSPDAWHVGGESAENTNDIDTSQEPPRRPSHHVMFLSDLTDPFDGSKLLFLQQALALTSTPPENEAQQQHPGFTVEFLDISCTKHGTFAKTLASLPQIKVTTACFQLKRATYDSVETFLNLVETELALIQPPPHDASPNDSSECRDSAQGVCKPSLPSAARVLESLPMHLQTNPAIPAIVDRLVDADVLVISNTYLQGTRYMLELARIASVQARVVDLGAIGIGGQVLHDLRPLLQTQPVVPDGRDAPKQHPQQQQRRSSPANALLAPSRYLLTRSALRQLLDQVHDGEDSALVGNVQEHWLSGAVDATLFKPTTDAQRRRAAASNSDCFRVLFVSNLGPHKGLGLLLKALAIVNQARVNELKHSRRRGAGRNVPRSVCVRATIVGGGRELQGMVALATRLGLKTSTSDGSSVEAPDVQFIGGVSHDELPSVFREADVFVFPTLSETFGFVGVEAMASGLPVVSLGVSATQEYVVSGCNAKVAADISPQALADAIEFEASLWQQQAEAEAREEQDGTQQEWSDGGANSDGSGTHTGGAGGEGFEAQRRRARATALDYYSKSVFERKVRAVYHKLAHEHE
jgi:glycosyltransferase involved in cell wall biosynthesis